MWHGLNSINRQADDRQLSFVSKRFKLISHLPDRTTWQVCGTFFSSSSSQVP